MKHSDAIELLDYSPTTGLFMWKKARRGVKTGTPLGTCNGFGYLRITVLGTSYYAHRLAWFYVYGFWPKGEIDHIDGNRQNNSIGNLRDVSRAGNAQNRSKIQSNSKSHVLGVSWHKRASKWQAHICVYKERKYLGLFNDIDEAHKAYVEEKRKVEIK